MHKRMKSGSEYWRRVEDLYHRAAECEGAERQALLDRECEGDSELRLEVEALLAGQERAQSFLEEPAVGPLTAGIRWSNYEILEHIGSGGMGDVYRARDTKLNRSVAIKFLSADLAGAAARRRFQREAQMASSLNHPHILTVHDTGEFEGQQYLVTEFVDGGTLREWKRREDPSIRRIIDLAIGIADALACAHQAGILHRDIKPENILVSKDNHAKLVDFGLAKLIDPEDPHNAVTGSIQAEMTRAGIILGTVAYMSPEQAAGRPVDSRSDVFAFGAVLYELLAGHRAFEGDSNVSLLEAIQHSPPRPLGELRPDIPGELRNVVEKALEKDAGDRYQSMREMVVDLKRVQRMKSAEPSAPPAAARAAAPVRRGYRSLVLVVIGAAAIAVTGWLLYRSDIFWINPLANAQFSRLTDFEGNETDASVSADGKFAVFLSDRDGVFDAWFTLIGSGEFSNVTKGSNPVDLYNEAVRNVGFSTDGSQIWFRTYDGKGNEELWVKPTLGGAARPFLAKTVTAAWSPDGTKIAFHESTPGDPIFLADRDGSNPHRLYVDQPGLHCHYLTWSPDGNYIYFVRGFVTPYEMDLWRVPSTGGKAERLTHLNTWMKSPTLVDNRNVLFVATAEDGSGPWLYTMDVNRRVPHRISLGVEQYLSIQAITNGQRLVATVSNPANNLWTVPISDSISEESLASRISLPTFQALSPRFTPDSFLYLSYRGADGIWKWKSGTISQFWISKLGGRISTPAVSPDGSRISFVLRKEGRGKLYTMTGEGTNVRTVAESLDVRNAPSWSPDGKWIAVTATEGNGNRIFKVPADGGSPVRLLDEISANPVWSPDGRFILYSGPQVGVMLPVKAVTPDGAPFPLPNLQVRAFAERYRVLPNGQGIVLLQGPFREQDFWLCDLTTGNLRRLTKLQPGDSIRSFDISHDGKRILFDRFRENSDIVLIDR
jgi:Tol biopolymer transport system component/predicted Ser/Thr protein kinase